MTEDLSICRSVMRIYSFCAVDEKTHRIKITGAHEIVKSYFEIEDVVTIALKVYMDEKENIRIDMFTYSDKHSDKTISINVNGNQ